jgi:hypothetical protein
MFEGDTQDFLLEPIGRIDVVVIPIRYGRHFDGNTDAGTAGSVDNLQVAHTLSSRRRLNRSLLCETIENGDFPLSSDG